LPSIQALAEEKVWNFDGNIKCDMPNENLEKWDAILKSD
jgi:hypothetical protein